MGLNSVDAVRSLLLDGEPEENDPGSEESWSTSLSRRPPSVYRYHQILPSRELCMKLRRRLRELFRSLERRDWLARRSRSRDSVTRSQHFLRNIGIKGHAILDKHVMRCLAEVGVVDSARPPRPESNTLTSKRNSCDLQKTSESIAMNSTWCSGQ
jgi:thermostable 8-oxoguanine DNA glycosylase